MVSHDGEELIIPAESVEMLWSVGERGAMRVAWYLRQAGFRPSPGRPVQFPAELLVGLEIALRLLAWEHNAITAHIDRGLPNAIEVLRRVTALRQGPELQGFVENLFAQVSDIQYEQLVWQTAGRQGADLAIAASDDDEAFLDAVADFLWQHRDRS